MRATRQLGIVVGLLLSSGPVLAEPQAYRYSGVLEREGDAAQGSVDLRLRFLNGKDVSAASEVLAPLERRDVELVDGRFQVDFEIDPDAAPPAELWVEVAVAEADSLEFAPLWPPRRLESTSSAAASAPAGAVVHFDLPSCPDGWSEYTAARGRVLLGLPAGGNLGGTVGTPLANLASPQHKHDWNPGGSASTNGGGSHTHAWAVLDRVNGTTRWLSWDYYGNQTLLYPWGNGIGNEGSGIYPLAANPTQTMYTSSGGSHGHGIGPVYSNYADGALPYVQLLACRKD